MAIEVETTALEGVLIVRPKRFGDARGYFMETYSRRDFVAKGIDAVFVQDNQSLSGPVGTVRALHFQRPPHAQGKLVRCLKGAILDVAVDLRRASATYGQHVAVELSAETGAQLWVPAGFAHGFVTLQPATEVAYKTTDYYAPECDAGIAWDDPDLGIMWPLPAEGPTLSAKDQAQAAFADLQTPF